ncbi:hypothetical protein B0H67DRAFT_271272 [Lasiosphaeris hirsuta]|uniref:Transmembrane protein n=1 Tax=Lasiosphaeris hirsuta TaxID=260670 RepID=A0AA40A808_9PEZI|nr:hypothetical protein B0H67DRAFT_271272 [Lasiosphaeris hirsuta]
MSGHKLDWTGLDWTGREEMKRFSFCQKGWTFDRLVRAYPLICISLSSFNFLLFLSRGGTSEAEILFFLFGRRGYGNGGFVVWFLLVLHCVGGFDWLFFLFMSVVQAVYRRLGTLDCYSFGRFSIPLLPRLQGMQGHGGLVVCSVG